MSTDEATGSGTWATLPGWDGVESGLDTVFKATLIRLWLYAMAGFTELMSPRAGELFSGVFTVLNLSVTAFILIGLAALRDVDREVRTSRRVHLAFGLGWIQLLIELSRVGIEFGLLDGADADPYLALAAHLCTLGVLLLVANMASVVAAFIRLGKLAGRLRLAGRCLALVAAGVITLALVATDVPRPTWMALHAVQMALTVGVAVLLLGPLHAVARRLGQVTKVSPPVAVAQPEATASDDDVEWVPRALRPASPAADDQRMASRTLGWRHGKRGLALLFRVIVARSVLALFWNTFDEALIDVVGRWTETVAFVAMEATSLLLIASYLMCRRLPSRTGARPLLNAALLLSLGLVGLEVAWFAGWRPGDGVAAAHLGTLLAYQAFQLTVLLLVLRGLWRLGRYTGSVPLRRRTFLAGYLSVLTVFVMAGASLLWTQDDAELNLLKGAVTIVLVAISAAAVIVTLQTVQRASEEVDDAIDRLAISQEPA